MEHTRLFLEGRNEELVSTLKGRMVQAAADEAYERAAQLRDAIRTIETLHDRQQKMATAELGDRDAFGVKLGPAGAVVQVFQVAAAAGRRAGRAGDRGRRRRHCEESEVVQAALQQFYADRIAPPEVHLPVDSATPTPR